MVGRKQHVTLTLPGLNSHCALRSRAGTSTPRGMKQSPLLSAMAFNGLWIPSKMVVSRPGPNSTDKGCRDKQDSCSTATCRTVCCLEIAWPHQQTSWLQQYESVQYGAQQSVTVQLDGTWCCWAVRKVHRNSAKIEDTTNVCFLQYGTCFRDIQSHAAR